MKIGFKEKISYWFDSRMSKGTASMIKLLLIVTLATVTLIALIIAIPNLNEGMSFRDAFWESLVSAVNAWMPESDAGTVAYVALQAVAAIIGLLFTSVLIGLVGNAIEEKLGRLRKGNSRILESGHTVILGFTPGEYMLISQLVEAAEGEERCIVVADEFEKDEMEDFIRNNVSIPKNVKIICRNANICDPTSLSCCSIPDCKTVIINSMDDGRTVKSIMAVSSVLSENSESKVRIIAAVTDKRHMIPKNSVTGGKLSLVNITGGLAMIMAHSVTEPGIGRILEEIFSFSGNEFHYGKVDGMQGRTFGEISLMAEDAVPVGIIRGEETVLNPSVDQIIGPEDRLIYFSEKKDSIKLDQINLDGAENSNQSIRFSAEPEGCVVIFGFNSSFDTVIENLPENVTRLVLAGYGRENKESVARVLAENGRTAKLCEETVLDDESLSKLAGFAEHILILSDNAKDAETADTETMLLMLRLREIRVKRSLDFTITAEMRTETNKKLMSSGENTDLIVASDMSAMILSQIAESPEIRNAFREIFSRRGNELCMKPVQTFGLIGRTMTILEIRKELMGKGYILLGYVNANLPGDVHLNCSVKEKVPMSRNTFLVVIGK